MLGNGLFDQLRDIKESLISVRLSVALRTRRHRLLQAGALAGSTFRRSDEFVVVSLHRTSVTGYVPAPLLTPHNAALLASEVPVENPRIYVRYAEARVQAKTPRT